MSMARIMRFLAGSLLAAILLAIALPFVGVPSSHFLPPAHVWDKAQGYARGVVTDKYYDLTGDPFHTGDQLYFVVYQFTAKAPGPAGVPGKPTVYKGTTRVEHEAYELVLRPKNDQGTYKAKDPIPVIPSQVVRVKYETTYPEINGVTALSSQGAWVPWGGRNIGAGGATFGTWLLWLVLAFGLGYGVMLILEKFAAQENI